MTECSITLEKEKDGETVSCWPEGDPVELAARIQDLIALYRKEREANPEGLRVGGKVSFSGCEGGCLAHWKLGFHADGTFEIGWDNEMFAGEALAMIEHMVDKHELLVHACRLCGIGGNKHSVRIGRWSTGEWIELPPNR